MNYSCSSYCILFPFDRIPLDCHLAYSLFFIYSNSHDIKIIYWINIYLLFPPALIWYKKVRQRDPRDYYYQQLPDTPPWWSLPIYSPSLPWQSVSRYQKIICKWYISEHTYFLWLYIHSVNHESLALILRSFSKDELLKWTKLMLTF